MTFPGRLGLSRAEPGAARSRTAAFAGAAGLGRTGFCCLDPCGRSCGRACSNASRCEKFVIHLEN